MFEWTFEPRVFLHAVVPGLIARALARLQVRGRQVQDLFGARDALTVFEFGVALHVNFISGRTFFILINHVFDFVKEFKLFKFITPAHVGDMECEAIVARGHCNN